MKFVSIIRHHHRRPHHRALIARLLMARPMTSLIERDLLGITVQIQPDNSDWVRMWVDPDHKVYSDCGNITAWRGITWEGELLWLVRHENKLRGYHSRHTCPFRAIEEAQNAWQERRRVREDWPEIKVLARDLFWGRQRMDVQIEDAHASALCTVGVQSFLARVGLGGWRKCSGRTAAILMLIEPQVGFVIFAARERINGRSHSILAGGRDLANRTKSRQTV